VPAVTLTAKFCDSIRVSTRTDYFDTHLPGLVLRVAPSGRKTWNVFARVDSARTVVDRTTGRPRVDPATGQPVRVRVIRRATLGTLKTLSLAGARERARDWLQQRDDGADPVVLRAQHVERTVNALVETYLQDYARVQKRSWRDDSRRLHKKVIPAWRHRLVKDISRADVRDLLAEPVRAGHITEANRLRALLSKVFNFAIGLEWIEINPVTHVPKPAADPTRDRVLTDEEVRTLVAGLDGKPALVRAQTLLRLYTAQRGGEVFDLRWSDLDMSGGWWTVPSTLAKNKLAHRVPLNRHAKRLLADLRQVAPAGQVYVFDGARGRRQRAGATAIEGLIDVRGHDIRRTVASRLAGAGVQRLVIAKLLNHVERGVTAVYDRHSYDPEKRAALDRWADLLDGILAEQPTGKVLHHTPRGRA
jgi:integrase